MVHRGFSCLNFSNTLTSKWRFSYCTYLLSPFRAVFTDIQPAVLLKQISVKSTLRQLNNGPFLGTRGRTFHTEPRDWLSQHRLERTTYSPHSHLAFAARANCKGSEQTNGESWDWSWKGKRKKQVQRRVKSAFCARPTYPSEPQTNSLKSFNWEIHAVILVVTQPIPPDHKDSLLDFLNCCRSLIKTLQIYSKGV